MLKGFSRPALSQAGIAYLHKFNPRIGVRLSYTRWVAISDVYHPRNTASSQFAADKEYEQPDYYSACKSIDLLASYRIVTQKRHEVYAGAGVSYIWGQRTKYTGYWPNKYDYRKIGMLSEVGYNYNFCHHRLNIGHQCRV